MFFGCDEEYEVKVGWFYSRRWDFDIDLDLVPKVWEKPEAVVSSFPFVQVGIFGYSPTW